MKQFSHRRHRLHGIEVAIEHQHKKDNSSGNHRFAMKVSPSTIHSVHTPFENQSIVKTENQHESNRLNYSRIPKEESDSIATQESSTNCKMEEIEQESPILIRSSIDDAYPDNNCSSSNDIILTSETISSSAPCTNISNTNGVTPDLTGSSSSDIGLSSYVSDISHGIPDRECTSSANDIEVPNLSNAIPDSICSSSNWNIIQSECRMKNEDASNVFSRTNRDFINSSSRQNCNNSSRNPNIISSSSITRNITVESRRHVKDEMNIQNDDLDMATRDTTLSFSRSRIRSHYFQKPSERIQPRLEDKEDVEVNESESNHQCNQDRPDSTRITKLKELKLSNRSQDTILFNPIPMETSTSTSQRRILHSLVENLEMAEFESLSRRKLKRKQKNAIVRRTHSFQVCWTGTLQAFQHGRSNPRSDFQPTTGTKIHTLILGTHPSVTSLSKQQYYAHPCNAFWWIAGDCLGFRRDLGISKSKEPYAFTKYLYYKRTQDVISYDDQLERFCHSGFALWDLFQSCERKGSMDCNIKKPQINDIRSFCEAHPTIRRIVFSNGMTQSNYFKRYCESWWLEGEFPRPRTSKGARGTIVLVPEDNERSRNAFGSKYSSRIKKYGYQDTASVRKITCVCMPGVSPANANMSYAEKRDYWKRYCYDPGLKDYDLSNSLKAAGVRLL